MKWTLKKVMADVRRMDANLKEDSPAFRAAVVLLAGLIVGANVNKVQAFTGYSRSEIRTLASRLREAQIWRGARTACEWDHPEYGGAAFWMDVCVAEGLLLRASPRS